MKIKPIRKASGVLKEIIPPLKDRRPVEAIFASGEDIPSPGEMMELTGEERKNFPKWMKKYGGFHLDLKTRKFEHD